MKRTALGLKGCALGSSYGGSGCYVGDACLSAQPQCSLGVTVMLATLANLVTCVHCCQYVWSYTCLCGHPTAHHSLPPSGAQLVKLLLAAMQSVNHVGWSFFCRIGPVDLKEDIIKKDTFTFMDWTGFVGPLKNSFKMR